MAPVQAQASAGNAKYSNNTSWKLQLFLFTALFAFRIVNGSTLKTFFQPDEFFQALEPAWHWTFGSLSGAWITWEWKEGLRASMHPLLFSVAYKIADVVCSALKLNARTRGEILVATPRLLQAVFAAITDLFTWRLAGKVYGRQHARVASVALILSVVSPWQWFCATRTFSNSLETTLTVVALDLFPWPWFLDSSNNSAQAPEVEVDSLNFYSRLQLALVAAATACVLRPTNVIIWVAISACLVLRRGTFDKTVTLLECALICGGAVLAISAGMDKMFYADWTFPALRFLYFNVVQSLAVFYGRNRWDYYFTEGLPLLLTTALPFGIVALWQSLRGGLVTESPARPTGATTATNGTREIRFIFAIAVLSSIIVLTSVAHKEVRFIYPLLPILHVLASAPIKTFFDTSPFAAQRRKFPSLGSSSRLVILSTLLALNILIAGYVSQYHQRGVIDVIHYLRDRQTTRLELSTKYNITTHSPSSSTDLTVAFLMPCHSTPWRSHLVHSSIDAWALTCEPPLDIKPSQRATYLDEADRFYADPPTWIAAHMRSLHTIAATPAKEIAFDQLGGRKLRKWPVYLVFFAQLEDTMREVLQGSMYYECRRFWNSHWHDDSRRQGDVVVWCLGKGEDGGLRREKS
jgi:phosphatidylinositol glycan class B